MGDTAKTKVRLAGPFATHEDAPVRTGDAQLGTRLATIGSMQQLLSYREGTPSSISELISLSNQKQESRGNRADARRRKPARLLMLSIPVETKGVGNYSSVFGQAVAIAVTIDWVNTFPFMTDDVGLKSGSFPLAEPGSWS